MFACSTGEVQGGQRVNGRSMSMINNGQTRHHALRVYSSVHGGGPSSLDRCDRGDIEGDERMHDQMCTSMDRVHLISVSNSSIEEAEAQPAPIYRSVCAHLGRSSIPARGRRLVDSDTDGDNGWIPSSYCVHVRASHHWKSSGQLARCCVVHAHLQAGLH
jgi:hypothetical protein